MPLRGLPDVPLLDWSIVFIAFGGGILSIDLLVLINEPAAQRCTQDSNQQTERGRDPHALAIEWCFARREDIRT